MSPEHPEAEVDFSAGGNAAAFVVGGWGGTETRLGGWSDQPAMTLGLRPMPVTSANVEVLVEAEPLVNPEKGVTYQRLKVSFNSEPIGAEVYLNGSVSGPQRFEIPAALWNQAAANLKADAALTFKIPDCVAPSSWIIAAVMIGCSVCFFIGWCSV